MTIFYWSGQNNPDVCKIYKDGGAKNYTFLKSMNRVMFMPNVRFWFCFVFEIEKGGDSSQVLQHPVKHAGRIGLNELINFYSSWNHQKTIGILMTSREIEVNQFVSIRYHVRSEI